MDGSAGEQQTSKQHRLTTQEGVAGAGGRALETRMATDEPVWAARRSHGHTFGELQSIHTQPRKRTLSNAGGSVSYVSGKGWHFEPPIPEGEYARGKQDSRRKPPAQGRCLTPEPRQSHWPSHGRQPPNLEAKEATCWWSDEAVKIPARCLHNLGG